MLGSAAKTGEHHRENMEKQLENCCFNGFDPGKWMSSSLHQQKW
jgi:hypothetical protein